MAIISSPKNKNKATIKMEKFQLEVSANTMVLNLFKKEIFAILVCNEFHSISCIVVFELFEHLFATF